MPVADVAALPERPNAVTKRMGEIVGAGLLSHVPTIVLPAATRRELNGGDEISLVEQATQCSEQP